MYWDLAKTFSPSKFDPTSWAEVAANAGMKYFVMVTKHCDGFAMFNTSAVGSPGQTVYGVTSSECPAQRDLFGDAVQAMRAKGMLIGAYASKADWHAKSYWDEAMGFPEHTGVNYPISEHPEKWET